MQELKIVDLGGKKMEEMLFNSFMGYLLEAPNFLSSQRLSLRSPSSQWLGLNVNVDLRVFKVVQRP
jgi:hypothetical protein